MPLSAAYFPNYFSIEDVLSTQERTPCKFLQDVPKLGRTDILFYKVSLNLILYRQFESSIC